MSLLPRKRKYNQDYIGKKSNHKRNQAIQEFTAMKKEYDFSQSVRNPYAAKLKKQVTIRLETETVEYFKILSKETGTPYQTLINSYLTDCAKRHIKPHLRWA